jgi:hypothetical protein
MMPSMDDDKDRQREALLNAQLLQDLLGTGVILTIGGLAALVIYFVVWP